MPSRPTGHWGEHVHQAFSIYLDLVRFLAAVLVYLWHSNQRRLIEPLVPMGLYGKSAVIAFFVLSGFVIAYVVHTKERDWRRFVAGRTARIFSVVIPVLMLTLMFDAIGRSLSPIVYQGQYPWDHFIVRTGASLAMLTEVWAVSITTFSNVPYWSIAYEWWYYVLFGLAVFVPGRWRWPGVVLTALLLGPKIILLAPVWLSGVLLYRWRWMAERSVGFGACLVVISLVGIWAFHYGDYVEFVDHRVSALVGERWFRLLAFSKHFLSDYLLCALVWMNFAGMRLLAPWLAPLLLAVERPVRAAASLTFTLYLLHQPALLMWAAVLRGNPREWSTWGAFTALTAVTIVLVSHFTEQRRHLLKAALERLLERTPARARAVKLTDASSPG